MARNEYLRQMERPINPPIRSRLKNQLEFLASASQNLIGSDPLTDLSGISSGDIPLGSNNVVDRTPIEHSNISDRTPLRQVLPANSSAKIPLMDSNVSDRTPLAEVMIKEDKNKPDRKRFFPPFEADCTHIRHPQKRTMVDPLTCNPQGDIWEADLDFLHGLESDEPSVLFVCCFKLY
jgi:hypothetical protein